MYLMVPTSTLKEDKTEGHRLMHLIIKLNILSSYIYFYLIKMTTLRLYLSFYVFQVCLEFLLNMHQPGPERNYKRISSC